MSQLSSHNTPIRVLLSPISHRLDNYKLRVSVVEDIKIFTSVNRPNNIWKQEPMTQIDMD